MHRVQTAVLSMGSYRPLLATRKTRRHTQTYTHPSYCHKVVALSCPKQNSPEEKRRQVRSNQARGTEPPAASTGFLPWKAAWDSQPV